MSTRLGRDPFKKAAKATPAYVPPVSVTQEPAPRMNLKNSSAHSEKFEQRFKTDATRPIPTSSESDPLQLASVALELARTAGMFTGLFIARSFLSRDQ